ncbi:MAG: hypothetical protein K6E97_03375 [Treponema sp.]|nr:hypothetical protein [Treponema sp.]
MYGFLLKKSFCDGWDNLLLVLITNIITLFWIVGSIILISATPALFGIEVTMENLDQAVTDFPLGLVLIQCALFIIMCIGISILRLAFGELAVKIADFDGVHIVDLFKAIPGVLKDAVLHGLFCSVAIIIFSFSLEFYFVQGTSIVSFLAGAFLFWLGVMIVLALQWFIPLRCNMHNNFRKCIKKCFIIFFDNTGFSILVGIHTLIMLALSVFLIGFMPFLAGISINKANALRLRLYKYDYLEKHPELTTKRERKEIPWDDLIQEDRDILGPRKLRSFLFPWKDLDNQQ